MTQVAASPSSGLDYARPGLTLTLNLSEAVTVAGGTPTLTLNDGGTATYVSGSGTSALTFSYTVGVGQTAASGAGDQSGQSQRRQHPGRRRQCRQSHRCGDDAYRLANQHHHAGSGGGLARQRGDEGVGKTITLTLAMSQAVTVAGTPTLTLNDGGIGTYTGGSGTSALTFSYTVGAGDSNVSALAINQVNLPNGAAIYSGKSASKARMADGQCQPRRRGDHVLGPADRHHHADGYLGRRLHRHTIGTERSGSAIAP